MTHPDLPGQQSIARTVGQEQAFRRSGWQLVTEAGPAPESGSGQSEPPAVITTGEKSRWAGGRRATASDQEKE